MNIIYYYKRLREHEKNNNKKCEHLVNVFFSVFHFGTNNSCNNNNRRWRTRFQNEQKKSKRIVKKNIYCSVCITCISRSTKYKFEQYEEKIPLLFMCAAILDRRCEKK